MATPGFIQSAPKFPRNGSVPQDERVITRSGAVPSRSWRRIGSVHMPNVSPHKVGCSCCVASRCLFLQPCVTAGVATSLMSLAITTQLAHGQGFWAKEVSPWKVSLPACAARRGDASPRTFWSEIWIWRSQIGRMHDDSKWLLILPLYRNLGTYF